MIVEKIRAHFAERSAERGGLFLRSPEERARVLQAINDTAFLLREEPVDKAVYGAYIDERFWVVVVKKTEKELVTIMYPASTDRALLFSRFERNHQRDLSNEMVQNFIAWRGDLAIDQFWQKDPPKVFTKKGNPIGPKKILLWGEIKKTAQWNGSVWLEVRSGDVRENPGHGFENSYIWGWMELELHEKMVAMKKKQEEKGIAESKKQKQENRQRWLEQQELQTA